MTQIFDSECDQENSEKQQNKGKHIQKHDDVTPGSRIVVAVDKISELRTGEIGIRIEDRHFR